MSNFIERLKSIGTGLAVLGAFGIGVAIWLGGGLELDALGWDIASMIWLFAPIVGLFAFFIGDDIRNP